MIGIQNIVDMVKEDVINLLLDQKEQPFKIYIPKSTQLFSSTNRDIAIDYAMLAYAGQLLKNSSDKFDYEYISPDKHKSVLFEIYTKNIEKLADAILEISYGYNNESDDVDEMFFHENAEQFLDDVNTEKLIPSCPDFIDDYNEYIEEEDGLNE
jgi:hypothetical protein